MVLSGTMKMRYSYDNDCNDDGNVSEDDGNDDVSGK